MHQTHLFQVKIHSDPIPSAPLAPRSSAPHYKILDPPMIMTVTASEKYMTLQ